MENFIFCAVKPKKVESIIKEVVILDNYLRFTDKANYTTHGFVKCKSNSGEIILGDSRKNLPNGETSLLDWLKDTLKAYFW